MIMKELRFQKLTRLMALLTFCLFAVCVLLVLLSGADVYRQLAEDGETQYARRTAVQYLTTRVRQAQFPEIGEFSGLDTLEIRETLDGRSYLTRIYCYEGFLRELFTPEEGPFLPGDGEKLLKAEALSLSAEDGLLILRITLPEGSTQTLYLRQKGDAP